MDRFVVIEIGSTNTKTYLYVDGVVNNLGFKTIEFKNNYKKENRIDDDDKRLLYELIQEIDEENIFVFGTSIFRNLTEEQKEEWICEFKEKTGLNFTIVTSDMESELTVYGVISNIDYKGKIAVMIGGGGSTELAIVENGKLIEQCNSNFGAMDTTDMYPDIKGDIAKSDFDEMISKTMELVNVPENKADLLVLAGGDYIYFYEELKYPVEKNKFYESDLQPYCLDTETMDNADRNFFYKVSLDEVGERTNNDAWWRGTRGMRLCVQALVRVLDAKYVIPTRISMVYGIVAQIEEGKIGGK